MISVISLTEEEKWTRIVKEFKNHDIYYLPEYTKAFNIHGDGEPILVYYKGESLRAINVVMKRDIAEHQSFTGIIPKEKYFDLATPYGYGGFLMEGERSLENIDRLDREYSQFCRRHGAVSEFVRFHPITENYQRLEGVYSLLTLGSTIAIDLTSENAIMANMTSQARNRIKKAKAMGLEVFWGRSPQLFKEFIRIYKETMDKNNAAGYYYFEESFFDSVLKDVKHNSLIFYTVLEERIIAMCIILFANGQLHYHICGSDKEYQHLAPTNLLIYETAMWGSRNGYKSFHLGGGLGCQADTLYRFKKTFNKSKENAFVVGRKIFDEGKYEELKEIRRKQGGFQEKSDFFPVYRG